MWETELPGICNRLIAGYKKLVENKYMFEIPDASRNAVKEYREENSPILGFISEHIYYTDELNDFVSTSDVYARYTSMCVSENEKPLTKMKFTQSMHRALPRISKGTVKWVNGKSVRVMDRLKLTEGEF
jgi:phage/plasmid-associated DNA primase